MIKSVIISTKKKFIASFAYFCVLFFYFCGQLSKINSVASRIDLNSQGEGQAHTQLRTHREINTCMCCIYALLYALQCAQISQLLIRVLDHVDCMEREGRSLTNPGMQKLSEGCSHLFLQTGRKLLIIKIIKIFFIR